MAWETGRDCDTGFFRVSSTKMRGARAILTGSANLARGLSPSCLLLTKSCTLGQAYVLVNSNAESINKTMVDGTDLESWDVPANWRGSGARVVAAETWPSREDLC